MRPVTRLCRLPLFLLLLLLLTGCSGESGRTVTLLSQPEATTWTRSLGEQPLRQTFLVPPLGLSEIQLVLALPAGAPEQASRPLQWQILDQTRAVLREGTLETAGYRHNSPLRINFDPIAGGESVELALIAEPDAMLSLWASSTDRYTSGAIADNQLNNTLDLHFVLRVEDSPLRLPEQLRLAADRWRSVALWIPLLLLAPGWLIAWVLRPGDERPITPLIAGLSLSLAPLIYLWMSLTGLRFYEPLVQSLFQAAALALVLLMVRDTARLRNVQGRRWRPSLALLGLSIILAIGTWLLAARLLVLPAGDSALSISLLAQQLLSDGWLDSLSAVLPPSAIATTLAQLSRQIIGPMLLLASLLISVSLVPALYGLAAEVTREPRAALWVIPLAWLWPTPWRALAAGEMEIIYSIAMVPVVVALGLRAMRATERPWRTILLASLPLAALTLTQGVASLIAWAITLVWALVASRRVARRRVTTPPDAPLPLTVLAHPAPGDISRRALGWLALAAILTLPAWFKGGWPLPPQLPAGYDLLLVAMLWALIAAWLARKVGSAAPLITVVVLISLPALFWWRSAPQIPLGISPTQAELSVMAWARENSPGDAVFLINASVEGELLKPLDGGAWIPLYGRRATILQQPIPAEVIARAMQPEGLADPTLRETLAASGVTHIFVGEGDGPLNVESVLGREWVRVMHQSGSVYVFELVPSLSSEATQ